MPVLKYLKKKRQIKGMWYLTLWLVFLNGILIKPAYSRTDRVIAVYRHGDRAPAFPPFPSDVNKDYKWEDGLANLTSLGRYRSFHLGKLLRNRYKKLFTDNINNVFASSSSEPRCVATTACLLTGLHRPSKPEACFIRNMSPLIPINTDINYMLNSDSDCPAKTADFYKSFTNSEAKKLFFRKKDLLKSLAINAGLTIEDNSNIYIQLIFGVYDTLVIEKMHNLTWNDWVEPMWIEIQEMAIEFFHSLYSTERTLQLQGGFLLKEIIDRLQAEDNEHNFSLYGTHDLYISILKKILGVDDGIMPPYCATLLFESTIDDGGQRSVRLFYKNSTTEQPYRLVIPGCPEDCPLDRFIQLTEKFVLLDKEKNCRPSSAE